MLREEPVKMSFWIPRALKELIDQYVMKDAHLNASDLIRDSIREKIQREAPELYRKVIGIE